MSIMYNPYKQQAKNIPLLSQSLYYSCTQKTSTAEATSSNEAPTTSLSPRQAFFHPRHRFRSSSTELFEIWLNVIFTSYYFQIHLLVVCSGMSTASKLTLAGTSLFAIGTIFFVHYGQQNEKAVGLPFSTFSEHRREVVLKVGAKLIGWNRQCTRV